MAKKTPPSTTYGEPVSTRLEEARRFAFDNIFEAFDRAGLYRTLLEEWLPDIRQTEDKQLQGDALNYTGKICLDIT